MADLAVADITKGEAIERLNRFKHAVARVKEQAKAGGRRTVTSLVTVAGAAAAGVVDSKMPFLPGFPTVPSNPVLGLGLIALGASGYLDDQSDHAAALGAGMLAPFVYGHTVKALAK